MNKRGAITAIEKHGMCLVFPIDNAKEPPSLWYHFFPKSKMRWEWDDAGDSRVAELWHLREELSRSEKVVYAKWYRDRATFFSHDVFQALVRVLNEDIDEPAFSSEEAGNVYQVLLENSPLSTKVLKRAADLEGKFNESTYTRALRELWRRLLIVGFGEIDDGAFPSLAVGAAKLLFEDDIQAAGKLSEGAAKARLEPFLKANPFFNRQLSRLLSQRGGQKNERSTPRTENFIREE